jgi:hypothetical protein
MDPAFAGVTSGDTPSLLANAVMLDIGAQAQMKIGCD